MSEGERKEAKELGVGGGGKRETTKELKLPPGPLMESDAMPDPMLRPRMGSVFADRARLECHSLCVKIVFGEARVGEQHSTPHGVVTLPLNTFNDLTTLMNQAAQMYRSQPGGVAIVEPTNKDKP